MVNIGRNINKFIIMFTLIFTTSIFGMPDFKKIINTVQDLSLIPFPREITLSEGSFTLDSSLSIFVTDNTDDIFAARQLQEEIKIMSGIELPVKVGLNTPEDIPHCIVISSTESEKVKALSLGNATGEEAYVLSIETEQVLILSTGIPGLFYGVQTMRQIVRSNLTDNKAPVLMIRDWPVLKWRGVLDDVTRGPCPLLETLKMEVRIASYVKQNFITFNQEEQYAFEKHPDIGQTIAPTGLMTPEELKELNNYSKRYHVTVIAMENSFGHLNDILLLDKYKHLRENPDVLSPALDETYDFLNDLYSSLIPYTDAPFFNIGADEVRGLENTQGPAKKMVSEFGAGGTYARHIQRLRNLVKENYDRRIMMWGDIILNHPDDLHLIPKDVIMLTWGYRARESFEDQITPFSESGYDFFVCPGVSCWDRIPPDFSNAVVNIKNFVRDGVKYGAIGMMNTMWDDRGENLFNLNWHGIFWGAECSWTGSKTEFKEFNQRIGAVLFGEKYSHFGKGIESIIEALDEYPSYNGNVRYFWNHRLTLNGWEKPPYPVSDSLYNEAQEKIINAQDERKKTVLEKPEEISRRAKKFLKLIDLAIINFNIAQEDAKVNADIIDYFIFGAKRLELLAQQELSFIRSSEAKTPEQKQDINIQIRKKFEESKETYKELWNRENKTYALDWVLNRYDAVLRYYQH